MALPKSQAGSSHRERLRARHTASLSTRRKRSREPLHNPDDSATAATRVAWDSSPEPVGTGSQPASIAAGTTRGIFRQGGHHEHGGAMLLGVALLATGSHASADEHPAEATPPGVRRQLVRRLAAAAGQLPAPADRAWHRSAAGHAGRDRADSERARSRAACRRTACVTTSIAGWAAWSAMWRFRTTCGPRSTGRRWSPASGSASNWAWSCGSTTSTAIPAARRADWSWPRTGSTRPRNWRSTPRCRIRFSCGRPTSTPTPATTTTPRGGMSNLLDDRAAQCFIDQDARRLLPASGAVLRHARSRPCSPTNRR